MKKKDERKAPKVNKKYQEKGKKSKKTQRNLGKDKMIPKNYLSRREEGT